MGEVTEITAVEEIRRKRAERMAAEQANMAESVAQDAVDAGAPADPAAKAPEIHVPQERRRMEFTAFFKDKDRGEINDTMEFMLPKGHPEAEGGAIAQVYNGYRSLGAVVEKKGTTYLLHPLDLFSHFEFEFSSIVLGTAGQLKNVTES